MSDRAVEGVGFENRSIYRYRGFESHLILNKKTFSCVKNGLVINSKIYT